MLFVKGVYHPFWVGIVLVEDWFPHRVPPEPVLDNVVQRDAQIAVLAGDALQLLLRSIAILALPIAVRPLTKEGCLPGQLAVGGDDGVKLGAVEEVIVNRVGNFRTEIERVYKTVVEAAP